MKKFLLFCLALFLVGESVFTYYEYSETQTISLSASQLFHWQAKTHIPINTLCALNILSVLGLIVLLNLLTKNIHKPFFITLAAIAGFIASLPNTGLILLGYEIFALLIILTIIHGFPDTADTINYLLFFYILYLSIYTFSSYGLALSLLASLVFGILAYQATKLMIWFFINGTLFLFLGKKNKPTLTKNLK